MDRRTFLRAFGMGVPALACLPGGLVAATPTVAPAFDLRFITQHLPVRRRHEWTRIAPNPARLRMAERNRYTRITLHHEGTAPHQTSGYTAVCRHLDGVLGGHLQRNFGDVGYHFLIDYSGEIWEGRSLAYWGAHVAGHNEHNLGIVLLGNFERQRPSAAQMQSMGKLVHVLRHHYRIRRGRVYGHIDLGQTLCPGKYLYPSVQQLNQLA